MDITDSNVVNAFGVLSPNHALGVLPANTRNSVPVAGVPLQEVVPASVEDVNAAENPSTITVDDVLPVAADEGLPELRADISDGMQAAESNAAIFLAGFPPPVAAPVAQPAPGAHVVYDEPGFEINYSRMTHPTREELAWVVNLKYL